MALIMLAELLSAKSEASQLSPSISSEMEAGLITGWGRQYGEGVEREGRRGGR